MHTFYPRGVEQFNEEYLASQQAASSDTEAYADMDSSLRPEDLPTTSEMTAVIAVAASVFFGAIYVAREILGRKRD